MEVTPDPNPRHQPMNRVDSELPDPSICFPVPCPFGCCGPQWSQAQDLTHLMLMLGIISSFALIIQTVLAIVSEGANFVNVEGTTQILNLVRHIFALLFGFPVMLYFFNVINQYDRNLQKKQKQARIRKENLLNSYKVLLSDMDSLLLKSAESASGLAERSFESKRRDFQRFLERAKTRYSTMTHLEYDLVPQFKRFCLNWLHIFKECSIDPINNSLVVVEDDELDSCTSIEEIATILADKLKSTEVRFITEQRNQDKMLLNNRQKSLKLQLTDGTVMDMESGGRKVPKDAPAMTWLTCGMVGCSCSPSNNAEGYPRTFNLLCMGLTILSRPHLNLLMALVWGISGAAVTATLYLELPQETPDGETPDGSDNGLPLILMAVFFAFGLLSLVNVLCQFEQIDVVQQLEREVQELTKQNEVVEGQRTNMKEFWGQAQQLTEMWLYRTVPRLDLCKELHSQLEDLEEQSDLVEQITAANNGLEDIEARLGTLENWRTDGNLDTETKKGFSKAINDLCTEQDLTTMLNKLVEVRDSAEMKAIQY